MNKIINKDSVTQTTLYKELENRNNSETKAFVSNIISLCDEASTRSKQIIKFFPEYTLHDQTHFIRVTELMALIMGENIKILNDIEIGLLILAAFYHDIGMALDENELSFLEDNTNYKLFKDNWIADHPNYLEIKTQSDYAYISPEEKKKLIKKINQLDSAILTDYLRVTHGQRSYDYIIDNFKNERILSVFGINLSNHLAKICLSHSKSIEWICESNGFNYDENIGTLKVNTIFLSLILRLADILDFDSDRTPDVLYKSIHFTSPVSITEWQKHRNVKGWEISKERIRFTMYFEHPVYEKTANEFINWIDRELLDCQNVINRFPANISDKYKISFPEKVDRSRLGSFNNSYIYYDLEFTLSRNEIVKLLMTDNLYKNTSLFLRELLQNSLDALRLRKAIHLKDGFEWTKGIIKFRHYLDDNEQQVVECIDNGVGMDEEILSKFLGKVGRSYYRSPEFETLRIQLKEKGVDFEPCSQFGIGFMSCFMIGDRIQILTRRDNGHGKQIGRPLIIDINGLGGLIMIREGKNSQEVGTKITVFARNKPLYFDLNNDPIRLLNTLKGYAVAAEFPIEASCDIKEIKQSILIPSTVDKKKTFLEALSIKSLETIEVNFSDINKNLHGFLRQSFLIDSENLPCLENEEAKWEVKTDNVSWKDTDRFLSAVMLKDKDKYFEYTGNRGIDDGITICLDGILICGYPGRSTYNKYEMRELGSISPKINSEHPFMIDVRGEIKPEINPAREPQSENGWMELPGWSRLQHMLNNASGLIWDDILNKTKEGLSPKVFWSLLMIYNGNPLLIPSSTLLNYLYLPVNGTDYVKLTSFVSFFIDNKTIIGVDSNGKTQNIQFSDDIINFGKTHQNNLDIYYWLSNILICLCQHNPTLKSNFILRKTFHTDERPSDNRIYRIMYSFNAIPFEHLGSNYILTTKHDFLVNSNNPLVNLFLEGRLLKAKDDLYNFAESFIINISRLLADLKREDLIFDKNEKYRSLKYASILYNNLDWKKYSKTMYPPYNIYVDENTSFEISEENFVNWAI